MEQRELHCQPNGGRKERVGEDEWLNVAARGTSETPPRDHELQLENSVTRARAHVDFQRVPASCLHSPERTSRFGEPSYKVGTGFSGSDGTETQLPSPDRCCGMPFSLPPSQFLLGLQSFSIQDGDTLGTPQCFLEGHSQLIPQWLRQQQTIEQSEEEQHHGAPRQQDIYRQQRGQRQPLHQPWQQRQARGQQNQHTHNSQWRRYFWQQQQADETKCTDVGMLPLTLLPASLSSITRTRHAGEEAEVQPDAGWQQQQQLLLLQSPRTELKKAVVGDSTRTHLQTLVGTAEKLLSASAAAEAAAGRQQQCHPHQRQRQSSREQLSPQRQHLPQSHEKGHDAARSATCALAIKSAVRMGDAGAQESVRHQVAGRFQMLKKLRHPHLCAYTHMLRKGRRIYVVSEYWSLSLAELLNQRLQWQLESRNMNINTSSNGSSPERSDGSTSVGVGSSERGRRGREGRSSSTERKNAGCKGEGLPLLPEEFLRRVVRQILSALEYLNSQGLTHARLSLSAIRLDAEGNVRVADWGLQHLTANGRCTPHTHIHPPLPFVPPETLLVGPFATATPTSTATGIVAAVRAPPTAGPPATAASCPAASTASGVASTAPAAAKSAAPASDLPTVPAVPVTATSETLASGGPTATGCWPNSSTGDVFSVGIIVLHLLQGPPLTPLPQALLETLRRQQTQQQRQQPHLPAQLLYMRDEQSKKEAERGPQQQKHVQPVPGSHEHHDDPAKHTGGQHHICGCPQESPARQEQPQLTPQPQDGRQEYQQAEAEHQQQGVKYNEKQEPEEGTRDEPAASGKEDSKKRETSTQRDILACGQPFEEVEENQEHEALPLETGGFFWDEWEGCERKKTKGFSKRLCKNKSVCRSQGACEADGLLQEPACCLRVLRHLERVALLLLYVHCGYEGLQKSLSLLLQARPSQRRAFTEEKLSNSNRFGVDTVNYTEGPSLTQAAATTNEMQCAAACADNETVLARVSTAHKPPRNAAIGSCLGQGLKRFFRQRQQVLLDKMRDLVRGPSSVTLQNDVYEQLVEIMSQYLRKTIRKTHVQQEQPVHQHLQTRALQFAVLGDRSARVAWQEPQQDHGLQTCQHRDAASAAPTKESESDVAPFCTQPRSSARSTAAEDVLLESVLSAAVDWLSGTNVWPAHGRNPVRNTSTAETQCSFEYYASTSESGGVTREGALRGVRRLGERTTTAARQEPSLTAEAAEGVSQELRDFLRMCLALSPNERPTPAEALNCAWLRQGRGAATQQPPRRSQPEYQRQSGPTPPERRGQGLPYSRSLHSAGGIRPLVSRGTEMRAKNVDAALWCPQAAAGAAALLQGLQLAATLPKSPRATFVANDCGLNEEGGRKSSVNLQTLLQQQYGVEVEEVFYWWQLLGHDVHATLTAMGAFHPVCACLRLPLASLLCTAAPASASLRAAPTVGDASIPSATSSGLVIPSTAGEVHALVTVKQETSRKVSVLCTANRAFWTRGTPDGAATSSQPTANAPRRGPLGARQQRWRVPFLLPLADTWGQLHGAVSNDSSESGRTNNSSRSGRSSSVSKRSSISETKEESSNTISTSDTLSCCCTHGHGWARILSQGVAPERAPGTAGFQQQANRCCTDNSRQMEGQKLAQSTLEFKRTMATSYLAAEKCSAVNTNSLEKRADLAYSIGESFELHVPSVATDCLSLQKSANEEDVSVLNVIKSTGGAREHSGGLKHGGTALVSVEDKSSFFACGLHGDNRKWTDTGFFWKEGDARIRGVELVDVLHALHKADHVPVSEAKQIRPPCIYARQRHFLYQRLRVRHFRLLLAQLPTSWPCLLQEAAVDIPPLLRPQIWAALLHLNYAAEAAAGPFIFDQLVHEAAMLPALRQLDNVKFFGCHEYHDVLGSNYGSTMLRRLLQAFFVHGASPSFPGYTSRLPTVDSKRPFLQQSEDTSRPSHRRPFAALEAPQRCRNLGISCPRLPQSIPLSQARGFSSPLKETTTCAFSEMQWNCHCHREAEGFMPPTEVNSLLLPKELSHVSSVMTQAPEQASLSVRGLDALAAPLLLLYENHPHLALLSLQRFLLRHEQEQLLISTPTPAAPTAGCDAERQNQQISASGALPLMKGRFTATMAAEREAEPVGGSTAAAIPAGWIPAATLQSQVHCYSQLLAFVDPVVAAHLSKRIGLEPEMYVIPWLLTFFSHALELSQLYLLWDVSLLRPPGFVLFVAVCLVHCLRVPLLKLGVDDELAALTLLHKATAFVHIPALSAAAVALQDATPPSILSSRIELFKPTHRLRRPSLSAAGAWSLSPSTDSAALSGTQRPNPAASDRSVYPQQLAQQAHRQQAKQQRVLQRHTQQTHRQREQWQTQQQRYQQHQQCADVKALCNPEDSLLPWISISDITELGQKQGCAVPKAEGDGRCDASSAINSKDVADAEQTTPGVDSGGSCRYNTTLSVTQRFYIGGAETPENAEEEAGADEKRQDKGVALGSGFNWQFPENWEPQAIRQRADAVDDGLKEARLETPKFFAVDHVIQHDRGGRSEMTRGCRRKKRQPRDGNERSNTAAKNGHFEGSNGDEKGTACKMQSTGKKLFERQAQLQRSRGPTSQTVGEIKQQTQGRAWDFIAAVIKGPALMLMGPPRKVRRQDSVRPKAKALQNSKRSSGWPSATSGVTTGRVLGQTEGGGQRRSLLKRFKGDKVQRPGDARRRWQVERQGQSAGSSLDLLPSQSPECCNAPTEPGELTGAGSIHSFGLPLLTLEDYLQHSGSATVLDVRPPSSFSQAHLLEAVNVSPVTSSALLMRALASAAAAAAAIRAPFPTVLLDGGSWCNNDLQSSDACSVATMKEEDPSSAYVGGEHTSEGKCDRKTAFKSSGCAEPLGVAAYTQARAEQGSDADLRALGRTASDVSTAFKADRRSFSAVTTGNTSSWAEYSKWPTCDEAAPETPSQPWIRNGLRKLHLVVIMGKNIHSAAELASRLRDSGVPHVCVLKGDSEILLSRIPSPSVRCTGPYTAETA